MEFPIKKRLVSHHYSVLLVAACKAEAKRSRYEQNIGSDISPILEEAAKLLPEAYIFEAKGHYFPKAPPDIISDWQTEFVELVTSGRIQTIGFRSPRQPESTPKFIPPDTWEGWVDWQQGTVSANGMTFVGVRIAPRDMLSNSQETERNIGRPSKKDQLVEAFHALRKDGLVDFSGPMNVNYPVVRRWVQMNYPGMKNEEQGLGDKTMARVINPLIAKHK